jgi:hypothetical protein
VDVLGRMVEAVVPGGLVLDLQVIRPNPVIESDGRFLCEIDGEPLFERADAATAAVEALIQIGTLTEEAVDDHDVHVYYDDGADVIAAFAEKERSIPEDAIPVLRETGGVCAFRERCRLRLLRVV